MIQSVLKSRLILALSAFLFLSAALPAGATSSVCSNPERERILATAIVQLPTDDIQSLEEVLLLLAPQLGMTSWVVTTAEPGQLLAKDIGLQSPEVSVSIEAEWEPGTNEALFEARRTCFDDALEPWEDYWTGFLTGLSDAGYGIVQEDSEAD